MPPDLQSNCITGHKLLEYKPTFYEVFDEASGEYKNTMKFEPGRTRYNPLDEAITVIIVDESSMESVDLFHKKWIALANPRAVQWIFLGDIQQLPPVFGSAILGYKMLKLPVVELTQVYRQALDSPIIRLAHRILSGQGIPAAEFPDWKVENKLTLHPWKKKISADSALLTLAAFFKQGYDKGIYAPEDDMILIPYNKACGTIELNKHIANHIAKSTSAVVHEIIAGFNKHYFRLGEKILYEKEDAEIIAIIRNPAYSGKWPQAASTLLDYWGHVQRSEKEESDYHLESDEPDESSEDIDSMMDAMIDDDSAERVRAASHILTVRLKDSNREIQVTSASEINSLILAYALTVHKSQGSEWRKVFFTLHQSHNTMLQRELLYTAVTRAREELYVICESDSFLKGIKTQRIKGETIAEKATYFQGKLDTQEAPELAEML